MEIPIYQVDAFTSRVFGGNLAAVCLLDEWLPDNRLQAIGLENNLSETAFLVPEASGTWRLRWFTPTVEVDLCGHATLASAFVLWVERGMQGNEIRFETRSGELRVSREGAGDGARMWLDFPVREAKPEVMDHAIVRAMGGAPEAALVARDYMLVYHTAADVKALRPEMETLKRAEHFAVIATAPGEAGSGVDFVSRFFAPAQGIPEDPVTGSAHCTLIPYWAKRLGKTRLEARQVSARGGELQCELHGHRVRIGGRAVLYLRGHIVV